MKSETLDICLSTAKLNNFLIENEDLLQANEWDIMERLWIYQLDKDGFLVSRIKFPKTFLACLYIHKVGLASMKDPSDFYFMVTKEYLNRNPSLEYPSQLRPKF